MEQFLPLIILAIVSFLANRAKSNKKPAQEQQKRAETSRPQQQPQSEMRETAAEQTRRRPVPTEATPRSLREAAETFLSQLQPQVEEKKEQTATKIGELEVRVREYEQKAQAAQEKAASFARNERQTIHPDEPAMFGRNDILNGIIMSEVLGPPRARKRYSRQRKW